MSKKLKPCPFCGNGDGDSLTEIDDLQGYVEGSRVITCECCGACGPVATPKIETAEKEWNRRIGQDD